MGWWTDRALPRVVDLTLRGEPIDSLRARASRELRGDVLEIGFGSGLNVPFYPPDVRSVSAVEPSAVAWEMSERRRRGSRVPITRIGLDGQRLEAADGSFDTVLSTFTLCTIPDVALALAEVRRVLRPGGTFHFVEHGLAPEDGVVAWQRRMEPLQRRIGGGCHLTRDVPALLASAGLAVAEIDRAYLPGVRLTRPWTYVTVGRAAAP